MAKKTEKSGKWWTNRINQFWKKVYRKKTDVGCVEYSPKTKTFTHFGGDKDGRELTHTECEEMARRCNLMSEVDWALFKFDDKPHQSWRRLLMIAQREDDHDSIVSCILFYELCATPKWIIGTMGRNTRDELIKHLRERKKDYDKKYHRHIDDAIKELQSIKFDRKGKMKVGE